MKFGHMILRKIFKFVATSGQSQILRLKRTEFDFVCGCTPDPSGELTALPQTHYVDLSVLLMEGKR